MMTRLSAPPMARVRPSIREAIAGGEQAQAPGDDELLKLAGYFRALLTAGGRVPDFAQAPPTNTGKPLPLWPGRCCGKGRSLGTPYAGRPKPLGCARCPARAAAARGTRHPCREHTSQRMLSRPSSTERVRKRIEAGDADPDEMWVDPPDTQDTDMLLQMLPGIRGGAQGFPPGVAQGAKPKVRIT